MQNSIIHNTNQNNVSEDSISVNVANITKDLDIMKDASEIVHYDIPAVPIYIQKGNLVSFPNMRALSHWHEDIEWMHILDNEMYYFINNKRILLKKGDTLMVNTKEFHYGYSKNGMDCNYICVLIKPEFLFSSQNYISRYVDYVYKNAPEYLLFHDNEYGQLITNLYSIKTSPENIPGTDLDILNTLMTLWKSTYSFVKSNCNELIPSTAEASDLSLQKEMVSFIHNNYQEAITLDDIAQSSNISRSTCCRLFKKYVGISPIDYLNTYRFEVASYLLTSTEYSVTQIATSCGINHLSYFSKKFKCRYGLSPLDYRNNN